MSEMADEPSRPSKVSRTSENGEKKRVCFICGSHTTLIVNIYEPRAGPNMVNIISEKFKTRPMSDDKFLCFSCNNWLINWYSLQPKTGESANDRGSGGGSTSVSGNEWALRHHFKEDAILKHQRVFHDEYNDLTITAAKCNTNDSITHEMITEDEKSTNSTVMHLEQHEQPYNAAETKIQNSYESDHSMHGNSDPCLTAAARAVRNKLQKYFYYPKKPVAMHLDWNGASNKYETANGHDIPNWLTSYHHNTSFRGQNPCYLIPKRSSCVLLLRQRRCSVHCKRCNRAFRPALLRAVHTKFRKSINVNRKRSAHRNYCSNCKKWIRLQIYRKREHVKNNKLPLLTNAIEPNPPPIVSSQCQNIDNNKATCNLSTFTDANSELVKKLKMLGTTLSYESDQCRMEVQQMPESERFISVNNLNTNTQQQPSPTNTPITLNHFNQEHREVGDDGSDRMTTISSNEIVLTFNTVVTEVFPIEFLPKPSSSRSGSPDTKAYEYMAAFHAYPLPTSSSFSSSTTNCHTISDDDDEYSSTDDEVAAVTAAAERRARNTSHIDDIIKFVPKSLTITLA